MKNIIFQEAFFFYLSINLYISLWLFVGSADASIYGACLFEWIEFGTRNVVCKIVKFSLRRYYKHCLN